MTVVAFVCCGADFNAWNDGHCFELGPEWQSGHWTCCSQWWTICLWLISTFHWHVWGRGESQTKKKC
jgi:hypothetical protein